MNMILKNVNSKANKEKIFEKNAHNKKNINGNTYYNFNYYNNYDTNI